MYKNMNILGKTREYISISNAINLYVTLLFWNNMKFITMTL